MSDTTNIIYWNANSLTSKASELTSVLQQHNASIALINETYLKSDLKLNGYKVYQNNRTDQRKGGGTAVIIRSNIKHHCINLPQLARLEATAIQVTINNKPTTLIAAYNPPGDINTNDFKLLFQTSDPIIVAGDFNAQHTSWHNITSNKIGPKLFELSLQENFIIQHPSTFTRYPCEIQNNNRINKNQRPINPSLIDLALIQNFPHLIEYEVLDKLHSDHLPVLMKIHSYIKKDITTKRNFNKANWSKYKEEVNSFTNTKPSLQSPKDIDDAVHKLTLIIQEAIKNNVPLCSTDKKPDILPGDILELINKRNKYRRINRRVQSRFLKTEINRLRDEIETKINNHKNQTWHDKVSQLSTKDNSAWRVTRALTRQTARVPVLKHNNKHICDPQEKAELLASTLKESFTPYTPKPDQQAHWIATELNVSIEMSKQNNNNPKKYRPSQIRNIIKKLKKRKAPGPDDIPNEALINLPDSAVILLTHIINSMLKHGYFPEQWKLAKVLMLPKPGKDHSDPNNYRPISLLCTLSKVAEKAILLRLQRYLHIKKTIRNEQFGFRSEHSTVQQVVRVVDDITEEFNKNKTTAMFLIDLQKAFDKVWHDGLISKLISLKVPNYIIRTLHSYLSQRSFYVDLCGYKSSIQPIKAGVPQGSILGPVLFNVYINDIPNHNKTKLAIYADDTAVYAHSWVPKTAIKYVQEHANLIAAWCNKWLLQVNASKCETILFRSNKRKHNCNFNFYFNEEVVQRVNSAKYLGVILDHHLSWNTHIRATRDKAFQRLGQLYPLLNDGSQIQTDTALHIYKATILPIMTYASPVWSGTTDTALKSLQVIQNKVAKIITKCPMYTRITKIHQDLNLQMLNKTFESLNRKFYLKSSTHSNMLINKFCNYEYSNWDKRPRPKDACSKVVDLNLYN